VDGVLSFLAQCGNIYRFVNDEGDFAASAGFEVVYDLFRADYCDGQDRDTGHDGELEAAFLERYDGRPARAFGKYDDGLTLFYDRGGRLEGLQSLSRAGSVDEQASEHAHPGSEHGYSRKLDLGYERRTVRHFGEKQRYVVSGLMVRNDHDRLFGNILQSYGFNINF